MKKIILIISSIVILTSIAITTILITKKDQYDLSNIKFENQVIEYDGESHSLVIDGKLPEGLNVVYSTNTLIDVGTIEVTASFIEEKGYEEVPDLKATLTIVPRSVTIRPNDIEVVYGDTPKTNGYQITSGEILSNDLESLNIQVVIDSTITNETSVGTYANTISIEYTKNDNYEVTLEKGTCSIVNPTIDMSQVTFNDKTFTYDGLLHTLSVENLPANVKVEYLVDGVEFTGTKNSGTYIVTAKFTVTNDNYVLSIDSLNATLLINKRSITLKPNDIEVVYGDTPKTNGYQITSGEILSNDLESLNINVVIDSTITNETSVGTYDNTISIEYTKNDNYEVTLEKGTCSIVNPIIDMSQVTFNDKTFTYDGLLHTLSVENLPANVKVEYLVDGIEFTGTKNSGTYIVTAKFTVTNDNYVLPIDSLNATLLINKRSITLKPNDIEVVYGDTPKTNGYQITSGEILSNDLESLNIKVVIDSTITNETSVGTYDNTISIEYTKNDNYDVTLEKASYKVGYQTIDMSQVTFNDKTFTYDGTLHSVTVENLPANVKVEYLVDGIEFIGTKNSGTYIVTAKFTVTNDNYVLPIDSLNATLQINKRSITLKPNDIEVVYGDTPKTNGYQITSGEILSNDLESLNIKVVIDSTITNKSNVGNYENVVSITYTKNENYDVTLEKASYKVGYQTIDMSQVTFNDQTFTYDGLLHTLSVENLPANVKVEYLVDGIEFTGTKNSGTYIVTAKFTVTNDNYVLPIDSLNATLQINKRSITLKPNDIEVVYGDTPKTNGYQITSGEILSNDLESLNIKVVIDSTITNETSVGTYDNTISIEYTKNDNYDVTLEKASYKVGYQTIDMSQVTFNDQTFTYDGLLHTLSVENLPANVKVEYLVDGIEFTGTKNSGTYIVTAKFTVTNDNYVLPIDSLNATLLINKRSITLKPNDIEVVYGDTPKTNGYQITSGEILSNDLESLNIKVVIDSTITNETSVGTYDNTISIEYTKNDNYDVTLEKASYKVGYQTIDMSQVTFNDQTFTYDGLLHTLSVENLPANVKVEYLVDGIEFTGTKNSGTYIVTAKFTVTNDNYVLSIDSLNATLLINKRSITLKPNDIEVVYGDTPKTNGYQITSGEILSNDLESLNIKVVIDSTITNETNIGTYDNTISIEYTKNDNYDVTLEKASYKVGHQIIDMSQVTFDDKTFTYDGTLHSVTVENLPANVKVEYLVDGEEFLGVKDSGTYDIIAKFYAIEDEYILSNNSLTATLTIEKLSVFIQINDSTTEYSKVSLFNNFAYTTNILGDEIESFEISFGILDSINDLTNAGTYENVIICNYKENSNYQVEVINGDLTIIPTKFDENMISFVSKNFSYDGLEHTITMDTELSDDFIVEYSNNVQVEPGEYECSLTITNPNYYDIPVYLAYLVILKDGKYHDVIFNGNNNEKTKVVVENNGFVEDILPFDDKIGYTGKWDYDFSKPITSDLTISLIYTPITYTISYIIGDGINNKQNVYEYNIESPTITLYPLNTEIGEMFISWHTDPSLSSESTIYNILSGSYGDITLYPKFISYKIESAPGFDFNYDDYELPAITMTVGYNKTLITLSSVISVSRGCTWTLSKDIEGMEIIKTKNMSLKVGHNIAYVTVWYEDLYNLVYILDIYRLDMKTYTFNVGGQPYIETSLIEEDSYLNKPSDPFVIGYTFQYWINASTNEQIEFPLKVTDDIILEAMFIPNTYILSFELNGADNNVLENYNVYFGYEYDLIQPTKHGYTFKYWELRNEYGELLTIVEDKFTYLYPENTKAYAIWEINTYNITYELDSSINDTNNPSTYTVEDEIILKDPSKVGYTFNGWYLDSNFINKIETIEKGTIEDINLFAKFTPNNYTITYITNGGTIESTTQVVTYDSQYELYEITKIGYTFTGYTLNEESFVNGVYQIPNDITIEANFTPNNYKITYITNGGTIESATQVVTYDAQYELYEITKIGYTFTGYTLNEESFVNGVYQIPNDITIEANFTINVYNITYELDGSINDTNNPSTYTVEDEIILKDPSKVGYTFNGWYLDSNFINKIETIEKGTIEDITLFAKFTPNNYTITYITNGGTIESTTQVVTYDSQYELYEITKIGYTFTGYTLNEESFVNGVYQIPNDITIEANFTINVYNITYELDGSINDTNNPSTYTVEDEIILKDPSKVGYTFNGWYLDSNFINKIETIEKGSIEDIALFAKFTPNNYTITYITNGGTIESTTQVVTYDSQYELYEINKKGYTFTGYTLNEESFVNGVYQIPNDITIEANFTINVYNITYELDSSINDTNNPSTYTVEDEIILKDPSKVGYTFNGWYLDSNFINKIETIEKGTIEDIALFAKFTPNNYKITYITNGGTIESKTQVVTYDSQYELYEITKIGYTFTGYTLNEESFVNGVYQIPNDITLEANFEANIYTITYMVNNEIIDVVEIRYNEILTLKPSIKYLDNEIVKWIIEDKQYNPKSELLYNFDKNLVVTSLIAFVGTDYISGISDGTATILEYIGNNSDILIPDYVKKNDQYYLVTSIGSYAFDGCSSLASIVIPDSVTSIGSYAFDGCSSLTSIVIPDSVTSIGRYAFRDCSSLRSIVIPDSVTSIGEYAFYECSSLIIYCEASSKPSGWDSSWDDSWYSSIPVVWGINNLYEENGILYILDLETNEAIIARYVGNDNNVIMNGLLLVNEVEFRVTSIRSSAFSGCNSLTSIVIPDSVTSIESYAFYQCSSLTSIEIPDSVTSIGSYAFYQCSSLRSIVIPDSVTSIESYVFYQCSSLTSIVIPDSVTSIGNYAFSGCSSLTIYCEASSKPSEWYSDWNSSNRPVNWGINSNNLYEKDGIQYIIDLETNEAIIARYVGNDKNVIMNGLLLVNEIEFRVTSIGSAAFSGCNSLTSIVIPDSVTSIGNYAFSGCSSLTSIVIPDSVTSIDEYAFSGCSSLTSIEIPDSVTSIGSDAFSGCSSLTSIVIPDSVTSIDEYAFSGCSSLTSIEIPDSVTSIDEYAFSGCSSLKSIKIPDSVTSIGSYAFEGCSSLKSIEIPESVTSIGNCAFSGCSSLTNIEIPDSVTSIGNYAFSGCSSLTSIEIPNSVKSIGNYAFSGCSSLTSIEIPDSVNSIGNYAFSGCSSLTSIEIPDSVNSIGNYAFYNCSSLTNIVIPDIVTSIGSYTFSGCSSLTSIEIPDSVRSIGSYAFSYCSSLTSIEIPDSVSSIGSETFYRCSSLTSIVIPDSVTSIGSYAFSGCSSLTSIVISDSVTNIGTDAFNGCFSLTSIVIPDSVTSIERDAFYGCSSLTIYCEATSKPSRWNSEWNYSNRPVYWGINSNNLCEKDGIQYVINSETKEAIIARYVGNDNNVIMSDLLLVNEVEFSVTSIGSEAFSHCSSLTSIVISDSVTSIGEYAFSRCYSLTSIVISDSVTSIGEYAFSRCNSLTSIEISDSVTSIGNYAFYNCSSLTSIEIPNSVTSIGSDAFKGCSSLTIYCEASSESSGWSSDWNSSNRPVNWGINSNNLYEKDGIQYVINSETKEAMIARYVGNDKNVIMNGLLLVNEIEFRVTSIGSYAFSGCSSLTSIEIPDSVTSIESYAFNGCSSLRSIVIPDSVTSIGNYAFYNCSSLSSIVIPESVTSIGNYAFKGCSSLTIYCEASSKPSEWYSDWNSSNRPVNWGINSNNLYEKDGIQYIIDLEKNEAIIARYVGNDNNVIMNGLLLVNEVEFRVTSIGSDAFKGCSSLTSIVIPDSVTSIGNYAFSGCSSLTTIEIPDSVTSIGNYAFSGCSSLRSIEIPDSVTSIGNYAFSGCSSLRSIVIPDSVTSIGNYAFSGCSSLTSIEIPDSVTSIGDRAFSECRSLTSIVIPNSVTSIGIYAFYGCSSLTIYCEASSESSGWQSHWNQSRPIVWGITSNNLYEKDGIQYVINLETKEAIIARYVGNDNNIIMNGLLLVNEVEFRVTSIGSDAFKGCSSLTSIVIPDSVTSIGSDAFYGCSSLTTIEIPDSVTSIGYRAFGGCSSLTSIVLPFVGNTKDGTRATHFGYIFGASSDSSNYDYVPVSLKEVIISDNVTSIGSYAFEGCSRLTSIVIPESVTSIGNCAFSECSSLTSIKIPESVTRIGSYAFNECSSLTSIEIPYSVINIETHAFNECSRLTICCKALFKPSGWNSNWNYSNRPVYWGINSNNLYEENGLCYVLDLITKEAKISRYLGNESVVIINNFIVVNDELYSVTMINSTAFRNCSSLTSIEIPDSVTSIGEYAFSGCSSLTSIEIPDSVTSIGSRAFSGCSSLTSIEIPDSVTSIGDWAFSECSSLTSIVIPDSVTSIRSYAFSYCSSLTNTVIPDSVTSIGSDAFSGCSSLTSIEIPDSVTSIGSYAFRDCSSLRSIEIPDSVTSIGRNPFSGCGSIIIYCEASSKLSGWYSDWNGSNRPVYWGINSNNLYEKDEIQYVINLETKEAIITRYVGNDNNVIMNGLLLLNEVEFSVTSIGERAFGGCSSLISIVIPDTVTSIGSYAFSGCSSLTSIVIPNSVTSIGERAFVGCSSLTIYCEASSKPSGWHLYWNSSSPVVWGYNK